GVASAVGGIIAMPTPVSIAALNFVAGEYTPYSAITGLNPSDPPPWGPLEVLGGKSTLADDEILVNDWLARDLWPLGNWRDGFGQPVITIRYFVEGEGWLLKEETATLKLAGVVPLKGLAADRTLTPEFPGIRGTSVADWNPPFPKEQWQPE